MTHENTLRGCISLINASSSGGGVSSLRISGARIASVGASPEASDLVVDLRGDRLLPGLINAHDHLQLNDFALLKYRDVYSNATQWICDLDARRDSDPDLRAGRAAPRRTRQLHGGLKNILSGVTTVAHHDPLHDSLLAGDFPTRVLPRMGWAHSLLIDGPAAVRDSHRRTPADWPWIIHAAEGIDDAAADEFEVLEALGCIDANTLLVHGVALNTAQRSRLVRAGAGLIWCPASNLNLFGRTTDVPSLAGSGRIALGSDSRMTGSRDLLAELQIARQTFALQDSELEFMVTADAARLLCLSDRGALQPGHLADLIVLPAGTALHQASRADLRMVMLDGRVRIGDPDCVRAAAPTTAWAPVQLDGTTKLMDYDLARTLLQADVRESGLEFRATHWRAA